MTKKEKRNLAKSIAQAQAILNKKDSSVDESAWARGQILYLSQKISTQEDLFEIDEIVRKILDNNLI